MFKVATMCSGIGSPEQSLAELGVPHQNVFACEKDKFARQTYLANFNPGTMYHDMTAESWDLPEQYADLIVAGIPCQSFSLAGKRQGENDPRGLLIYDFIRYIKNQRPKVFIIENVKGLLSDNGGVTFSKWCDLLGSSRNGNGSLFTNPESCGYNLHYRVLNAKHYGLPQNRERVFIVGIRPDIEISFRWPKAVVLKDRLIDLLEPVVDEKYYLSDAAMEYLMRDSKGDWSDRLSMLNYDTNEVVSSNTANHHKGVPYNMLSVSMRGRNPYNPKSRKSGEHTEQMIEVNANPEIANVITSVQKDNLILLQGAKFEANRIYDSEGIAKTQKSNGGGGGTKTGYYAIKQKSRGFNKGGEHEICPPISSNSFEQNNHLILENRIRRLTPLECMRLMGYPDSFIKPCSETQTYKQAGNSIPVRMMKAILRQLLPILAP